MRHTLRLNADLRGELERPFKETMFLLGREFTKAITDPIWTWPTGESPRDIVDTGQLRSSQQLTFPAPLAANFDWPVEYAVAVHEGATLIDGTVLPARPWTTHAIQQFDVQGTFSRLYRRYNS